MYSEVLRRPPKYPAGNDILEYKAVRGPDCAKRGAPIECVLQANAGITSRKDTCEPLASKPATHLTGHGAGYTLPARRRPTSAEAPANSCHSSRTFSA